MANLNESSSYDEGVYRLETTDLVQGGETGTSNKPLKNLANRTKWLHDAIDAINTALVTIGTTLSGLKSASTKVANAIKTNGDVPLWDSVYSAEEIDTKLAAITGTLLGNGIVTVGDIDTGGKSVVVSLGKTLANASYGITGSIISKGTAQQDVYASWGVESRTTSSFTLRFQENGASTQNIDFYWEIKAI